MIIKRRVISGFMVLTWIALTGCAERRLGGIDLLAREPSPPTATEKFGDIPYASWADYEPAYRFYPGDEIEVSVPTAS